MAGYNDIVNIAGLKSAQIDEPDFPIHVTNPKTPKPTKAKPITKSKLATTTKRGRKTKVDKLIDFVTGKKEDVRSRLFTSIRARKNLLRLVRLIYAQLNICQIIELLLLQCLEQNKELLPDNYLELIYPDEPNLPSSNSSSDNSSSKSDSFSTSNQ
ncbi:MAG: hypothetical protein AB8G86_23105 [Saprospiraceae bacterium]